MSGACRGQKVIHLLNWSHGWLLAPSWVLETELRSLEKGFWLWDHLSNPLHIFTVPFNVQICNDSCVMLPTASVVACYTDLEPSSIRPYHIVCDPFLNMFLKVYFRL